MKYFRRFGYFTTQSTQRMMISGKKSRNIKRTKARPKKSVGAVSKPTVAFVGSNFDLSTISMVCERGTLEITNRKFARGSSSDSIDFEKFDSEHGNLKYSSFFLLNQLT
jgi:hypothetical protein